MNKMNRIIAVVFLMSCILCAYGCAETEQPSQNDSFADGISLETDEYFSEDEANPDNSVNDALEQMLFTSSNNDSIRYWLYTPANAVENMPLIVYLHGGSGQGDDLNAVVGGGFPKFLMDGDLGNIDAYIIMPQLSSDTRSWRDAETILVELIMATQQSFVIDANRISLTGHSLGGRGAFDIVLASPELFSCVAPMSGNVLTNERNVNKLRDMPVWAFVGSADEVVGPERSIAFIECLQKINPNAQITIFEDAGHVEVPELAFKTTDVISWLISNSK